MDFSIYLQAWLNASNFFGFKLFSNTKIYDLLGGVETGSMYVQYVQGFNLMYLHVLHS